MQYLNENLKAAIKAHCLAVPDQEACGLVYNNIATNELGVIIGENVSPEPQKAFVINQATVDQLTAEKKLVAYFHSHLTGNQISVIDRYVSETIYKNCIIYFIETDSFYEYEPTGYEVPLVGRPYLLGVLDCYTLVKDYFRRMLNIELTDIVHPVRYASDIKKFVEQVQQLNPDEAAQAPDFLFSHLQANSFVEVDRNSLRKHDILLMQPHLSIWPSHLAVYLGNNQFLHQKYKKKSTVESLSDFFQRKTIKVMRHSKLI